MSRSTLAPGAADSFGRIRRLPPGAPKYRRRAAQRPSEIAAAARALISEVGFDQVTVAQIAARAGLSRGGVTRYFPTKGALWRAASLGVGAPEVGDHQPRRRP